MLLQHLYYDDGVEDANSPTGGSMLHSVELAASRQNEERGLSFGTPHAYRRHTEGEERSRRMLAPPAYFTPVMTSQSNTSCMYRNNDTSRASHPSKASDAIRDDGDAIYINSADRKLGQRKGGESHNYNPRYSNSDDASISGMRSSYLQSRPIVNSSLTRGCADDKKQELSPFDRRLLNLIAQRETEFTVTNDSSPVMKSRSLTETTNKNVTLDNHNTTVRDRPTTTVRSAIISVPSVNTDRNDKCTNTPNTSIHGTFLSAKNHNVTAAAFAPRTRNCLSATDKNRVHSQETERQTPTNRKHMVHVASPARDRLRRAKRQEEGRKEIINKLVNFGSSSQKRSISLNPKDAYLTDYYTPNDGDREENSIYSGRSGSNTMKSRGLSRSSFISYSHSSSSFANPLFRPPTLDGINLVPTRVLTDIEKHVGLSAIQIVLDITSKYSSGDLGSTQCTASRPPLSAIETCPRMARSGGKSESGNYITTSRGAGSGGWNGFIARCNHVLNGNYLHSMGVVRREDRRDADDRGDYYHYESTTDYVNERGRDDDLREKYDDRDHRRYSSTTNLTAYNVLKHIAASALSKCHGVQQIKRERAYSREYQATNVPDNIPMWTSLGRADLERVLHVLGQHFDEWGALDPFTLEYYVVFSCCDYLSKGGCGGSSGIGGEGGLGTWRPKAMLLPSDDDVMLLVVSRRRVADLLEKVLCPIVVLV